MATRTNIKAKKAKVAGAAALGATALSAEALTTGPFDLSQSPLLDAAFKLLEAGQEEQLKQDTVVKVAAVSPTTAAQSLPVQANSSLAAPEAPNGAAEEAEVVAQAATPPATSPASGGEAAASAGAETATTAAEAAGAEGAAAGTTAAEATAAGTAASGAAVGVAPLGALAAGGAAATAAVVATNDPTTAGSDLNDDNDVAGLGLDSDLSSAKLSIIGSTSDHGVASSDADASKLISAGSSYFDKYFL